MGGKNEIMVIQKRIDIFPVAGRERRISGRQLQSAVPVRVWFELYGIFLSEPGHYKTGSALSLSGEGDGEKYRRAGRHRGGTALYQ